LTRIESSALAFSSLASITHYSTKC
jgi:hypothetical protein